MKRSSSTTTVAVALSLAAAAAPQVASASGFALKEQSASGLGTAFAGATAIAEDPSVLFFNPAGMARLEGTQLLTVGSYVAPAANFSGRGSNFRGQSFTGDTGPGDAAEDAFLPAAYGVMAISPEVKLGLAATSPWGMTTEYPENWVGRYHATYTKLRTYNFGPAASYEVSPKFSLGLGLQVQYITAELSQMMDLRTMTAGLITTDGKGTLKGDDIGFGFTAGALYSPWQSTRVGVGYRSAVNHELSGNLRYDVPNAMRTTFRDSDIRAKLTTPDSASLGLYQELTPQVALVGDVSWTHWSRFKDLRINTDTGSLVSLTEEKWKNTWCFALGAIYKPSEQWTLRLGAAYDQTPVPDSYRTPRIPDNDRYWLAVGAGYKLNEHVTIDAAYSHLFVNDASVALSDSGAAGDTNRFRGSLFGTYSESIDLGSIQVRYKF